MNRLAKAWLLLTVATSTVFARIILTRHAEPYHYPRYAFKYAVHDPKTKDHKEHWETRNGDLVKGAYSLVEPDGKLRTVDYWADDAHGFNADVQRLGLSEHPHAEPAPILEESDDATPEVPENASPAPQQPEEEKPTNNEVENEALKPLVLQENYGFGSGGDNAPLGRTHASVSGTGSLQWDSKTGSYGGWVPLKLPEAKYATIFSKQYIDGKLHEWAIGPISLVGRTLVFKVKHH